MLERERILRQRLACDNAYFFYSLKLVAVFLSFSSSHLGLGLSEPLGELGVVPRTQGVVPRTQGVVPRTQGVVPRTQGVVPRTQQKSGCRRPLFGRVFARPPAVSECKLRAVRARECVRRCRGVTLPISATRRSRKIDFGCRGRDRGQGRGRGRTLTLVGRHLFLSTV
jgi:hypothetical protein